MKVTLTRGLRHRCPYVSEDDIGFITISYLVSADEEPPELHALAARLDAYESVPITHEALTDHLVGELSRVIGRPVTVSTRWVTAGFEVTVEGDPPEGGS